MSDLPSDDFKVAAASLLLDDIVIWLVMLNVKLNLSLLYTYNYIEIFLN